MFKPRLHAFNAFFFHRFASFCDLRRVVGPCVCCSATRHNSRTARQLRLLQSAPRILRRMSLSSAQLAELTASVSAFCSAMGWHAEAQVPAPAAAAFMSRDSRVQLQAIDARAASLGDGKGALSHKHCECPTVSLSSKQTTPSARAPLRLDGGARAATQTKHTPSV